jgi:hypothetical protein
VSAKKGLVACFDILGYRAIQPRLAFDTWKGLVAEFVKARNNAREAGQFVSIHVFGDSIFVFAPLNVTAFMSYCRMVFWKSFEAGMPLRGAISGGDYFESFEFGPIYAGLPVIEAHEFSNALEVSACVLTPSAERWLPITDPDEDVQRLSVPLKNVGKQNLLVMKPYHPVPAVKVIKAFSAHDKPIGPAVLAKLNNTVELLSNPKLEKQIR